MVYDFGGGTFDCTALGRDETEEVKTLQVLATKGNHILGGEHIDEAILHEFLDKMRAIFDSKANLPESCSVIIQLKTSSVSMLKLRQIPRDVKVSMTKNY